MSIQEDAAELRPLLTDLLKQAIVERSHHYTARVVQLCIQLVDTIEAETPTADAYANTCAALDRYRNDAARLWAALVEVLRIADETAAIWDKGSTHDVKVGKLLIALTGRNSGYRKDIDAIHTALAESQLGEAVNG